MFLRDFLAHNIIGIHYTVRIIIGTTALWFLTQAIHAASPLWSIISLIIVTETQMRLAWLAFRTRIINTMMGAAVGFIILLFVGATPLAFICAISFTALLSTYINRVQQGWRIAPITTALVISAGMTQQSVALGMHVALSRTFEVFLGSAMALWVTLVIGLIWLPPQTTSDGEKR